MWTIIVQAGGESRRMGENKALKLFRGQPLIERVVSRLAPVTDELLIISNTPEAYRFLNLPIYRDVLPGKGALGGLYTALTYATQPVVAVIACDMPFINPRFLLNERQLLEKGNWDVVIPESQEGPEPLHAVYRRNPCLAAVRLALENGQMRMTAWLGEVRTHRLSVEETGILDPGFHSFINVNTPEEFKQAELLDLP